MCTFSDAITTTSCTGIWNQQAFGREHPHKVQIFNTEPPTLKLPSIKASSWTLKLLLQWTFPSTDNSCILFIILCAMCDVGYFGRKGTMNRPSVVGMTRIALYKCFILLPPNQGARRTTRVILRLEEQPEKDEKIPRTLQQRTINTVIFPMNSTLSTFKLFINQIKSTFATSSFINKHLFERTLKWWDLEYAVWFYQHSSFRFLNTRIRKLFIKSQF